MTTEEHRLLELLASAENGCTASLLVALGFETDLVVGVVAAGLAESETERRCDGSWVLFQLTSMKLPEGDRSTR